MLNNKEGSRETGFTLFAKGVLLISETKRLPRLTSQGGILFIS